MKKIKSPIDNIALSVCAPLSTNPLQHANSIIVMERKQVDVVEAGSYYDQCLLLH